MLLRGQILALTIIYVVIAGIWLLLPDAILTRLLGADVAAVVAPYRNALFIAASAPLLMLTLYRFGGGGARLQALKPKLVHIALASLVLGIAILAGIAYTYDTASRRLLSDNLRYLASFTDVQARTLDRQRTLRIAAAEVLAGSAALTDALRATRDGAPDPGPAQRLLRNATSTFDVSAFQVFDREGRRILGTEHGRVIPPGIAAAVRQAAETRKPVFVPLWDSGDGDVHSGILSPIIDASEKDAPVEGVLLAENSAAQFLFPLLTDVLRGSKSTDVFLMRPADGGRWVITSPQRGASFPPLSQTIGPLSYDFAAAPGSAQTGIGTDHLGRVVLAFRRPLEGTPAHLVAKIDVQEALGDAQMVAGLSTAVAGLSLMLAFAIGFAVTESAKRRATARIVAQARALDHAEIRFRATFEQAAVGIAHVGMDDRFIHFNQTLCDLVGYTRNELKNLSYQKVCHPDDAQEDARLRQALISGAVSNVHVEKRHIRKDGSIVWIACTVSLARTPEGEADYFIIVAQDMTERRAQEIALRESRERFELAVGSTEEGVWDWLRRSGDLYLSERCYTLLGLPRNDHLDLVRLWCELLHPDDRAQFRKAWHRLRNAQENLFQAEVRMRHADGTYHDFRLRGCAKRDAKGVVVRLVGMLADETEHKKTERHLRLAGAVFVSSNEGLVVTDLKGTISAANPSFTRITGYTEAEAVGSNMHIMRSGRHDEVFYQAMWRAIQTEGGWQGEIWNRRKNGEVFLQQLVISTVYDGEGQRQAFIGAFHDITAIKRSEVELDRIAHYDLLTDLPNRTLLTSLLEHVASRPAPQCAVLCVDLDHFKTVNESFGHVAGDQVLQMAATRMHAVLGSGATLGRYGADEFLVIMDEMKGPQEAAAIASAIIDTLAAPYVFADGQEVYVGTSVGISLCPQDAENAETLVQHANSALFEAKNHGRGTYAFYTQELTETAKARIELEAELRRALVRKEFELHYQPCVDLTTGHIRSVEALLRWRHPTRGLVPPDRFIPFAEESGLIVPLGDWVMEEACRQMATWLADGVVCDYVAVNLSPRQFSRENVCERVKEVLRATGLPPERLELEITEGMLFEARATAEEKCRQLAQMGVHIALDDFGTGYSSLGYLKRFPISKLKIDRSFVRDLPRSVADGEITVAIIAVAKALGMEVVAEGIETEAQFGFLRERYCDLGQGYLFSRPLTVSDLEAQFHGKQVSLGDGLAQNAPH